MSIADEIFFKSSMTSYTNRNTLEGAAYLVVHFVLRLTCKTI